MTAPALKPGREAIWIAWEPHRRSESLAGYFGISFCALVYDGPHGIRHHILSWRTHRLLWQTQPALVVVQNPSLVLTALAVLSRPFLHFRLCVDAHNCAIPPDDVSTGPRTSLQRWLLAKADITMVTNAVTAKQVSKAGGTPVVLPDQVPTPPSSISTTPQAGAVLIASWADDEPIEEVVAAFARLPNVPLTITGQPGRGSRLLAGGLPPNVRLSGFLPEADYWQLIASAAVVIDLSLLRHCLVCGAYEALAVGTPMVLSDDPAVRSWFPAGVQYTAPDADSIASAVTSALENREGLRAELVLLQKEIDARWHALAAAAQRHLQS